MNYDFLLDIIEIFAGAYLIYDAIKMKQTGQVSKNGLLSKGLDLNKAPDPAGYINVMFKCNLAMGILLALCGIVSRIFAGTEMYNDVIVPVTMVVAVIALLGYGFINIQSQKKYLTTDGVLTEKKKK